MFFKLILILLSSFSIINAKELIVSQNGSIQSIKLAIDSASDYDTIKILKGVYSEGNIVVNKSVTIIGEDYPVIDGLNNGEIFTVTAKDVKLSGLAIKNSGISYLEENAGVKLKETSGCKVYNNRFINNFFAVYVSKSFNCVIENNIIEGVKRRETNSGNGIHLWYCKNVDIIKNKISNHRDGIYFEFVKDGKILNNVSKNNLRYGLHFMFSDSCEYKNNLFENNGAGVAVMYTKNIFMEGNTFKHNWGSASYGILLKDISDSEIVKNNFEENSTGIYIEGCSRINISKNNFINNGWAVKLMANSMNNNFTENNFLSNSFDLITNSKQNFNNFQSNYWSKYSGYDLNKDGIGDIPFRPVTMFSTIVESHSTALILLNSLFIQLLDLAERVIPALTPQALIDPKPRMQMIK